MPVTQPIARSTISRDSILGYSEKRGTLAAVTRRLAQISSLVPSQENSQGDIGDATALVLGQMRAELGAAIACMAEQLCDASPIIVAANTAQTLMSVLAGTATTIVWEFRTIGHYLMPYNTASGQWTPQRAGYYRVQVYFNDLYGNSSTEQRLRVVTTGWASVTDVDQYTGTYADRLAGEAFVYCNGSTDTISAAMYNAGASDNLYRSPMAAFHCSYIHIQYIGTSLAGAHT